MPEKRIAAFSSSRVGTSGYLEHARPLLKSFLGGEVKHIAFLPFAAVDADYNGYADLVAEGLTALDYTISVTMPGNAATVINDCDAIMVGGGNTFKLLHDLYAFDLFHLVKEKVNNGTPYVGWSAGSNITGLTIGTTNDMPIIEPLHFTAFGFLPFQINPHYKNENVPGFNGETRDQRLSEFIIMNPDKKVVALPEGTALFLDDNKLRFYGEYPGYIFHKSTEAPVTKSAIDRYTDLSFLLT